MQMRIDQCGVCKGTPVAVMGRPHPERSTKFAIEKRRRRQFATRWTVSRCALILRRSSQDIRPAFGPAYINQLSNRQQYCYRRQTPGRIQGVSALFRGSVYLAKILGGATD